MPGFFSEPIRFADRLFFYAAARFAAGGPPAPLPEWAPMAGEQDKANGPKGRASAWLVVAAGIGLIFLAIPLARSVQGFLDRHFRTDVYLGLAAGFGVAGLVCALRGLVRTPGFRIWSRLGWLAAAGAGTAWLLRDQLQSSAEAFHFVEYAALGVLFFQAWRLHLRDPLVYPLALASVALVAWTDEFLQWLMPGRYWCGSPIFWTVSSESHGLIFPMLFPGLEVQPQVVLPTSAPREWATPSSSERRRGRDGFRSGRTRRGAGRPGSCGAAPRCSPLAIPR